MDFADLGKTLDMPVNALLERDNVFNDMHRFEECRTIPFSYENNFLIPRIMSKDKKVENCL